MSKAGVPFLIYFITSMCFQAAMMAFFPLYFTSLGFDASELAFIGATENVATMTGPLIIALLPLTSRGKLLLTSIVPIFCLYLLSSQRALSGVILGWYALLFFNRASLTTVNTRAIEEEGPTSFDYPKVRLWGSASFIVATWALGRITSWGGMGWMLITSQIFLFTIFVSSLLFPKREDFAWRERTNGAGWINRNFILLLLSTALLWFSHMPIYIYLSVYLQALGWEVEHISYAWGISVAAEIVMFYLFNALERHIALNRILQISLMLTTVRWLLMGASSSTAIICFAQLFHAFSFASSSIAIQKLVRIYLPNSAGGLGQGLVVALGSGVGALLGKLTCAYVTRGSEVGSNLFFIFYGAAASSSLAAFVSLLLSKPVRQDGA